MTYIPTKSQIKIKQEPKLLPGDFAIWMFIFMELLVFAIAFLSYAVVRMQNIEMFNEYQLTLNLEFGAINTLLLITASYFVIRAGIFVITKIAINSTALQSAIGLKNKRVPL